MTCWSGYLHFIRHQLTVVFRLEPWAFCNLREKSWSYCRDLTIYSNTELTSDTLASTTSTYPFDDGFLLSAHMTYVRYPTWTCFTFYSLKTTAMWDLEVSWSNLEVCLYSRESPPLFPPWIARSPSSMSCWVGGRDWGGVKPQKFSPQGIGGRLGGFFSKIRL